MKTVIIAGNAPSLKNIDYAKLPKEYDVFRCNQFYFEEKYYLGKNIKAAFFNPFVFFEQYYTCYHLKQRQEYNIENIFCTLFNLINIENEHFINNFYSCFPDAINAYDYFKKLKNFDAFCKFNELYLNNRITQGIYMCAIAIALGYSEIYLAGIDLYANGGGYAFNTKKDNLLKLAPSFNDENSLYLSHNANFDILALEFLKKEYNVNFYSICNDSPINDFVIKASVNNNSFNLENKKEAYINDIILPSKEAYDNFYVILKKNKEEVVSNIKLKDNIYYKIFNDFFRLPSDIKHYIKSKKIK
ncbi:alpha-2,3 sialyltransferase [Campylobacter canadensis]|uniref:alpha-2,3-sialyltransferase n=1 Tax=Campylobacter canadensis TaxID=449520 RepID=UPI0015552DF9|nr:alpha-2,3-sialyltransferase [Campylobacter canadensis]MBZ7997273.1 alpha-2,3 sialyltransferase [Campylobacter canadensis]MBZ8000800.1 alpha-2,3 sialyltransferase [Campylobacter canadensis]MBZ8002630.1 alpha-2,3 sialyltransferase [Campylobacter canadensis]